ncbi:hypothetical protein Dimus_038169 [Dionaea muscipula]
MESRAMAALLSSLVSQLLLILLVPLLSPSSPTSALWLPSSSSSSSHFHQDSLFFSLIHHFLSSSEIAAALSLLPRKRRRIHLSHLDSDSDSGDDAHDPDTEFASRFSQLERVDSFILRNPDSFRLHFRMTASTFEWLVGLLEPLLDCRDPIGSPLNLSPELRLGIGLYRLSTGSDYPEISSRFRVSESVARFCAKQLCRVLCTNFRFWVGFPSPSELETVSKEFETITGLPNCCGVIGCTRFVIKRADRNGESESNINREETVAAQIIVDSSSRILSIIAGFNGDKDDSTILKSSTLYKDIKSSRLLNSLPVPVYLDGVDIPQYLVGDSGYPLLPWLLVPFLDPSPGSCEENFNAGHLLMMGSMLKTVASLRSWGVLSSAMQGEFRIRNAVACIGACSILHNALLMRGDYSALCDSRLGDNVVGGGDGTQGRFRRANLEETSLERKAFKIRSVLATKAKHFEIS